ncbi:MAG TPA: response regulator transcription factor, partial [Bacteroidales bacterium]|nr:response regulator transcription factor [Bacteroidales bacterium]
MPTIALIVEDHPIVSDSIARLLDRAGSELVCLQASTGSKGLAIMNGQQVDIVLLDIHLPDMSGIEFCKTVKNRFSNVKVLAITSLTQRHIVEQMFAAGAEGFVLKTSDPEDILVAVNEVLSGNKYLGPGVKELAEG